MAVPSPVKITKNGVEYISKVDRTKYTLQELTRAALKDVGKLLRKRMIEKFRELPGMKKHKRIYRSTQFWVRKQEGDLVIGLKHGTWYGADSELGSSNQPKRGIVRDTTFAHIEDIRRIEGQYLQYIEDENKALGIIDESEGTGDDDSAD